MSSTSTLQKGFTANQLKLLAMVTMTLDHIGLMLLPNVWLLRAMGRLSLPIYAWFIAEGCRRTRSRGRYFLRIFGLGLLCQAVYFFAMGSLYQCVLMTFSLSIALICLIDRAAKKRDLPGVLLAFAAILGTFLLCEILPGLLPGTDFSIDYGFVGVLLPVLVFFAPEKTKALTAGLMLLALRTSPIQWFSLAAIPMLGMYNGQKGKPGLSRFFYLYYPAHLVVLYFLSLVF